MFEESKQLLENVNEAYQKVKRLSQTKNLWLLEEMKGKKTDYTTKITKLRLKIKKDEGEFDL